MILTHKNGLNNVVATSSCHSGKGEIWSIWIRSVLFQAHTFGFFYVRLCQWRSWNLTIANSLHSKTIPMATPHERIVRILITAFSSWVLYMRAQRVPYRCVWRQQGRLATFSCRQSRERNECRHIALIKYSWSTGIHTFAYLKHLPDWISF